MKKKIFSSLSSFKGSRTLIITGCIFFISITATVVALTDSQKDRANTILAGFKDAALGLSGNDLTPYYSTVGRAIDNSIETLTYVKANLPSGPTTTPTPPTPVTGYINFVAGDRPTCNSSIVDRLGSQIATCSVGGGCGISCGKPGGSCVSANPSLWGACIDPAVMTTTNPNTTTSCNGTLPTGAGVLKRTTGFGGLQDTSWLYVENNGTYTADDFGSTACKWTCAPNYTRNGNTCTSGTTNSNGTVYVSNTSSSDLSKPNGTAYSDKQLFVILDGVSQSNPPKGCAKPAGGAGCSTPSAFRDYTSAEWVTPTRIVSGGPNGINANTFPNGSYEFYSLNGTTITKVGTASLTSSPSVSGNCSGTIPTGAGVLKRTTGFGGVQDTSWSYVENNGTYTADDFGSNACKWTCAPNYTRNGNSCTSGTTTPTTPQPTPTCTGIPAQQPSGAGVTVYQYNPITVGGGSVANTVWAYGVTSCGWKCDETNGYTKKSDNTGCTPPAPGKGIIVTVLDTQTQQPVSGVSIEFIDNEGITGTPTLDTSTTGADGKTKEAFDTRINMIQATKAGYIITSGGMDCTPTGSDQTYCNIQGSGKHAITIHISNQTDSISTFKFQTSVMNGTLKTWITGAGPGLIACTDLASKGSCTPTTALQGNAGWEYSAAQYSTPDVYYGALDISPYPKTDYVSCFKNAQHTTPRCEYFSIK